jgi:hypothetical protein
MMDKFYKAKQMGKVKLYSLMKLIIKDNLKMINLMDLGSIKCQMEAFIKECFIMESKMEKENIFFKKEYMKDNFVMICFTDKDY